MYEKKFLEQALEELEILREENEQLKLKLLAYEKFMKDLKDILERREDVLHLQNNKQNKW